MLTGSGSWITSFASLSLLGSILYPRRTKRGNTWISFFMANTRLICLPVTFNSYLAVLTNHQKGKIIVQPVMVIPHFHMLSLIMHKDRCNSPDGLARTLCAEMTASISIARVERFGSYMTNVSLGVAEEVGHCLTLWGTGKLQPYVQL